MNTSCRRTTGARRPVAISTVATRSGRVGLRFLLAASALSLMSQGASAATYTWTNSTGNTTPGYFWGADASKWAGSVVPVTNSTDSILSFASSQNVLTTNDLGSVMLNKLLITGASGTKSLTIAGSSVNNLNFVNNSSSVAPTLVNDRSSTGSTTLSIPFTVTDALTITNTSGGNFTISGAVANAGGITIGGSSATTYQSITSGVGGITYNSSSSINTGNTVNSSYTGATTLSSGILIIKGLANGGSNSSIGASSNAASNLVLDGGILRYTGTSTQSTNRNYTLTTNGGGLDSSGTGASTTLTFSGNMTASGSTGSQTFTLTGTGDGVTGSAGVVSGSINNGSGTNTTALTKAGTGTWTLSGSNAFSGATSVMAGILNVGATGALTGTTDISVSSGATFNVVSGGSILSTSALTNNGTTVFNNPARTLASLNGTNSSAALTLNTTALTVTGGGSYAGVIQNGASAGSLAVTGGTLTLSGASTHTGGTSVSGGATLNVTGSVGATTVSGTSTLLNGTGIVGAVTLGGGGTLGGSLTTGAVTVQSGGVVSPGNSPGTLNSSSATLLTGGSYVLQMNNDGSTGSAGTNWDKWSLTGNLNITALNATDTFGITLQTLDGSNALGLLTSFDSSTNHTWSSVITTGGITGTFASNLFLINTAGFQNSFAGSFSLVQNGNNLDLVYTAVVPEPGTWAMLVGGLAMLVAIQRRRSRVAVKI